MSRRHEGLPLLPLRNSTLFPHLAMPLAVGRPRSVAAVEAALKTEDKTLVVATQRDPAHDEPGLDELFPAGTLAAVKRMERTDEGLSVLVQGLECVDLQAIEQGGTHPTVTATTIEVPDDDSAEVEALQRRVLELARGILELVAPQLGQSFQQSLAQVEDPLHQVYMLTTLVSLSQEEENALLAARTRQQALQLMHDDLARESQVRTLQREIADRAESEMSAEQRKYYLRQQLRAIQEELGESSSEEADVEELRRRLGEADLPEAVRTEVERELGRLERMSAHASDYQVTRSWIELVVELPWQQTTDDQLDLGRARQVLDEDHHDLDDVKDLIVEHLAVMELNPRARAPILCFVGPPGVGKTSLGQSIARALGRVFERISLGGLHDEAELRGHRRTYIGAMPGRILQAVRRAGVRNPLLMLDEIDKLGRDFRGDPAAALMEVLDPAQNDHFRDNYLDLPFDLSRIFFITTANTLDSIPAPLLDRMEVLRLAGYTAEQKRHIARAYLLPRRLAEAGLDEARCRVSDETLDAVIQRYTREAGVRELERSLGRIARKVARRLVTGEAEGVEVGPADLDELLGPERFLPEKVRAEPPPGVVAGLAWTPAGGDVLYVEAVLLPKRDELLLTGQLGQVMQESAQAARSWVIAHAEVLGLDADRVRRGVHVHVPAGAVPKDGPSAGVTVAAALASLYAGRPVPSDTAMTGEITLSGLVLPVGGIKEKVLAAHRSGMRRVLLPADNRKDLRDVPDTAREALDFVFVERLTDVLSAVLPDVARPTAGAHAPS